MNYLLVLYCMNFYGVEESASYFRNISFIIMFLIKVSKFLIYCSSNLLSNVSLKLNFSPSFNISVAYVGSSMPETFTHQLSVVFTGSITCVLLSRRLTSDTSSLYEAFHVNCPSARRASPKSYYF